MRACVARLGVLRAFVCGPRVTGEKDDSECERAGIGCFSVLSPTAVEGKARARFSRATTPSREYCCCCCFCPEVMGCWSSFGLFLPVLQLAEAKEELRRHLDRVLRERRVATLPLDNPVMTSSLSSKSSSSSRELSDPSSIPSSRRNSPSSSSPLFRLFLCTVDS